MHQAAAVVAFGIAEAAEAAIIEGAKKLVNDLINRLEQHIIGQVLEKAVTPLEGVVERSVGRVESTRFMPPPGPTLPLTCGFVMRGAW